MKKKQLKGKRFAILAADGFEYAELALPKKALKAAGAKVDVVSLHSGRIRGMTLTTPSGTVCVDRTLEQAQPDTYDGLFIPGGFVSPDLLRQSQRARAFVREFEEAEKPIATICHGPWLLASAELVTGRSLASWPGIRDDLVHAGAVWRDQAVVTDRNWVSSRSPQDLPLFIPAMLNLFANGQAPEVPGMAMSSAKPLEPATMVVKAARYLPGPLTWALAGIALAVAGAIVFSRDDQES